MKNKVLLTLPLIILSSTATANDFGALKTNAQSPFHSNSLTTQLRTGIQNDATEIYGSYNVSSMMAEDANYKMDYLQDQANLGFKMKLTDRLNFDTSFTYIYASENNLDDITYKFHNFFNLSQNGREDLEYGANDIETHYGTHDDFTGETLSQAITMYFDYDVWHNENHGVTIGTSFYYNDVNSGDFERDSFEQAIQANYAFQLGDHNLYSTLGVTFTDTPFLTEMDEHEDYRNVRFMTGVGYNYAISENHQFIAEMDILQGAFEESDTVGQLSMVSYEVSLGYRYIYEENTAIEVSMIENIINHDNSADIAFTIGLRHKL